MGGKANSHWASHPCVCAHCCILFGIMLKASVLSSLSRGIWPKKGGVLKQGRVGREVGCTFEGEEEGCWYHCLPSSHPLEGGSRGRQGNEMDQSCLSLHLHGMQVQGRDDQKHPCWYLASAPGPIAQPSHHSPWALQWGMGLWILCAHGLVSVRASLSLGCTRELPQPTLDTTRHTHFWIMQSRVAMLRCPSGL